MIKKNIIAVGLILIFLCAIAASIWHYYSATVEVCNSIKHLSIDSVISITKNRGLHIAVNEKDGSAIIHSPWTYGRAVCFIKINNKLIIESEFQIMD